ncbi:MAG: hypothetical protein CME06_10630 [Gemmatimonadetes bacterium]|nr:hypothetical protein [Gemmatimonadota bacterium]
MAKSIVSRFLGRTGIAALCAAVFTGAGFGIDLQIENNQCPDSFTITAINGTPNATVAIVWAQFPGLFIVPYGPCTGTPLGLDPGTITLVQTFSLDGNGFGYVDFTNVPPIACRGFVQLLDLGNCATSTVQTF